MFIGTTQVFEVRENLLKLQKTETKVVEKRNKGSHIKIHPVIKLLGKKVKNDIVYHVINLNM